VEENLAVGLSIGDLKNISETFGRTDGRHHIWIGEDNETVCLELA